MSCNMLRLPRLTESVSLALFLLPTVFCISGCEKPLGSVSGTVTAVHPKTKKMTPIQFGRITFYNPDVQIAVPATIKDGMYTVKDVPPGHAKITISSFDLTYQERSAIK